MIPANAAITVCVSSTLAALSLSACAHGPPAQPASANPASFTADSSFRTLASRIDALGPRASSRGCLLARSGAGYELAADLAPAVSPLPAVEPGSLRALRDADSFRLVSRWGTDGEHGPYVGTFTHHPPPSNHLAVVIALSGERATLRSTIADGPSDVDLDRARVVERLEGARAVHALLVVAPDATVTIEVLAEWLTALDSLDLPMALGMVLETDRDLAPPHESPGGHDTDRCEALPTLDVDGPIGALTPAAIRDALGPMRDSVAHCGRLAPTRAVASGGRLRVGVRIAAEGHAATACVTDDGIGDDAFRICVVEAARALAWPAPAPAGFVDVYFPLVVAPDLSASHRGMCRAPRS